MPARTSRPAPRWPCCKGNPREKGLDTLRVMYPANYKIPAHSHPTDQHIVVPSGALYVGPGDKLEPEAGKALKAGGFAPIPARKNHYEYTKEATTILDYGMSPPCRPVADRFGVDWHLIGDVQSNPDNERLVQLFDRYEVDYIVLARYMRLIPPSTCWQVAGGRIINMHHGLLPAFPGADSNGDA